MTTNNPGRGAFWLAQLTKHAGAEPGYPDSVRVVNASLAGQPARFIAVVPDPHNRFPRARNGEIGLTEGWEIARAVRETVAADQHHETRTPIIAVIDVPSQAYGLREEGFGIHQALAGAAAAYASARLEGHPVIGLIVGHAISGAFLAHGYQANRLIALHDPKIQIHAMGKQSAARITLRSVQALEKLAATIPPMAYDIESFASLGLLWRSLRLHNPDQPAATDIAAVTAALEDALADIRNLPDRGLGGRVSTKHRQATDTVRELLYRQWMDPVNQP